MSSYVPVLSRELDLSSFKDIAPGKSRRISVFPDNATSYNSSSSTADIFFSIPSSRNSFIVTSATQLVFDITCNATFTGVDPALQLCNGTASSVLQSVETILQNVSVENILNYNVYAALINDLQPIGRSTTLGSILQGSGTTLKTGITLSGTTGVDGITLRCAVPLYSGVYGVGSEQFAPMYDGGRIRATMAATGVALKSAATALVTATQYKLSNIALQMEVMDLDSMTMNALLAQSGSVLKQHITCVNNYQSTIAVATANSVLIPARFSSVKALLTTFRLSSNVSAPDAFNVPGDRIQPNLASYFYNIDGANVPSVPVRVGTAAASIYGAEAMSEIMKTFGASNQTAFDCVFTRTNFNDVVGSNGTGSFFLSTNFEAQDSAGSALISGRDLNASNVYLQLTHFANPAAVCLCDTFALYDVVLSYMADGSISMSK
jgi:hypothetical protein